MSKKTEKAQSKVFAPLELGQRISVTKQHHIPGRPVLSEDGWKDETTEGVITSLKRIDGGVSIELSQDEGDNAFFSVGISPLGLLLNHNGTQIKILEEAPEQAALFAGR